MDSLLGAILGRVKGHSKPLPYNLNWGVKTAPLHDFLCRNAISVVDVGARGGAPGELEGLSRYLRYVGFDADEEECNRLRTEARADYASYRVFPYFLGDGGSSKFHIYEDRGTSSTYQMSRQYSEAFLDPPPQLTRVVEVQSTTLDSVMDREGLDFPDFLKLDTQGSELDILRGASDTLAHTSLVEVEVEFYQMYEGQPLFADVDTLLRSYGFELLYLNRVFEQRGNIYKGLSRGQLLFGDGLYAKSPSRLDGFSAEKIAKYVILLCHYGHIDLGYQIYSAHDEVRRICPAIAGCFSTPPPRVRRKLTVLFDRLLLLALHARRTNHMLADWDRSWPVR